MNGKLLLQAVLKFLLGVVCVGMLIFLPAGTLHFFNGWLLMGVLFVPMLCAGIVLAIVNPELLSKRLNAKEERKTQDQVVKLSGLIFVFGFVTAGLNFRYGWFSLPLWVVISASVLFIAAYLLYAEVLRENAYLSRTIKVQEGQTVIDTGLYGIVRHPMYSATLLLFLAIPLILGSLYAFLFFLAYPFILVRRIKDEESLLEQELDGYNAYKEKVKYRLIPYLW